jgi:enoyl-CoA hydratase
MTLRVEWGDRRVVVQLDRPARRNAINLEMVGELHAVLDQVEQDPQVVIVTGGQDGRFAAGADIAELRDRGREDALQAINLRLFDRLRRCPLPTIAAVDGPALGGGAELAYACDIRIASERAVFGQPEGRLGIMAAAGGCRRLVDIVGESMAKDMLFTGRRLSASEASAHGLVTRVVPPANLLQTAMNVADAILESSPAALRITKIAVDAPPEAHPAVELLGQAILFDDAESKRRMTAFLDR